MSSMDIFLGVSGVSAPELIRLARLADRGRFRTLWVPDITFGDAFTIATALAGATDRVRVGPGVAGIYSRSPVVMAQQTFSLNEFFPGRAVLGLGTQAPGYVENWHGVPYEHVLTRMREYVQVVRAILSGDRVTYEGKTLRVRNFQLMKPAPAETSRIYVAAIGPRMIQVAGEVADGLIGYFYSTQYVRETVIPNLEIGAQRAGRSLRDFDVGCGFPTIISSAGDAVELMQPHVMMYITGAATTRGYRDMAHRAGFGAEVERIALAIGRGDMEAAVQGVTPEMCRTFALCGTPEEVRKRIDAYYHAGLTSLMLNPIPPGIYYRLNEGHFPPDVKDQPVDLPRFVSFIEEAITALG